ncbi:hypothetical protein NDI56_00760 [Haloarcula sp. S1CR25-12]|uniref:MarR family transcriptional regulator n=1 Tax=Haloarcula saliterrae TaxID=2950534 RepID=A0ABU2F6N5_9EURY|nr:hypothetical protein [Haloarcula sp. S1CR25-12]MDS0257933.1 hypothetical protein [Haloarcula sp. S1CR25-12]
MRTVRDESGTHYILLKESSESSLVRDPKTGAERHVANEKLASVDGESPLATAATAVPDAVRTVVTAAHDEHALGLLVELDTRGPLSVHELLDSYDLCESDLHGLLGEFRAAGLVEEADVFGQRGYDTTDTATDAVAFLTS